MINLYIKTLSKVEQMICQSLLTLIETELPTGNGKLWHGHPVWFIHDNPVVGFSKKKSGVEILFWSGQSFDDEHLIPIGKYKAAGFVYQSQEEISKTLVKRWLTKARKIQWDYKNLPKNKKLIKLTEF